jgi:hypothetical protein
MGLKPSVAEGLMLRPVVCVTGCVLILGSVVGRLMGEATGEAKQGESPEAAAVGGGEDGDKIPGAELVAYKDGSWTVPTLLTGSGRQRGHIHFNYADLDELNQALASGALEEMLAAAVVASLDGNVDGHDGAGSCCSSCAPVVARWGDKVQLRLVDLCENTSSSRGGGGTRDNSRRGVDLVRVVISHHNEVLHDGSEQLLRPGGVGDDGTAVVPAAAAGSVGGGGDSALIQLVMPGSSTWRTPAATTSSNAAAALSVTLLPLHAPAPSLGSGGVGAAEAPLGWASVLLLPDAVADELTLLAEQRRLCIGQLAPLLQDMAFVLDARELLLQVAEGSPVSPDADRAGESAASSSGVWVCSEEVPGLTEKAIAAVSSLLGYLEAADSPNTADFVAVLRQQLLLAAVHAVPYEMRVLSSNAAAIGEAAAADPSVGVAENCDGVAAALSCSDGKGSIIGASCRQADAGSSVYTSSSKNSTGSSSKKSEGTPQAGAGALARFPRAVISSAERAAISAGGWPRAALCWRGFSDATTEARYRIFFAGHLRIADWAARACVTAVVSMMMIKYTQETAYYQQQVFGVLGSMFGEWGGLALRSASWLHRFLKSSYKGIGYTTCLRWCIGTLVYGPRGCCLQDGWKLKHG